MSHIISIELDRESVEHIRHFMKVGWAGDWATAQEFIRAADDALILDDAEPEEA